MNKPISKNSYDLDELGDKLAPILRRHAVVRAAVFGSIARGEATDTSDLDLSVEFKPGSKVTLFSILDLQHEIEDEIGKKVHISLPDNFKPYLRENVSEDSFNIL